VPGVFHVLALAASMHGQPEAATSGQESESRRTLQNRSLAGRSGFDRLSEATWMPWLFFFFLRERDGCRDCRTRLDRLETKARPRMPCWFVGLSIRYQLRVNSARHLSPQSKKKKNR
jgi:hypothetical protein